jgi:hypothetical protein
MSHQGYIDFFLCSLYSVLTVTNITSTYTNIALGTNPITPLFSVCNIHKTDSHNFMFSFITMIY